MSTRPGSTVAAIADTLDGAPLPEVVPLEVPLDEPVDPWPSP